MLHERRDESFHWKNKLEELDHLPTEPAPDKGELWKRLHARLSQKHNKSKAGWYWAAAACVLLAVGISWLFIDKKTGEPVTKKALPLPQQSSNKDIVVRTEAPKVDTQHINVIAKQSKKAPVVFNNKKKKPPKMTVVAKQNNVSNLPGLTNSLQIPDKTTFQSSDTVSSNSIAAIPSKKRLRVIHINDLEKPSEQEVKFAASPFPASQRKKHPHEGVSPFSLSKNTSDDIVKIKLSPSN